MLRTLHKMLGFSIHAKDGEIGRIHDFYIDIQEWKIRYVVVHVGAWFVSQEVFVAPEAIIATGLSSISVDLTREQVRNSPKTDLSKPITRQYQTEVHNYYSWPIYWEKNPPTNDVKTETNESVSQIDQPILPLYRFRSFRGVRFFSADGEMGHVDDIVGDDEEWMAHYIIIDTRNFVPGKKVLIAPQWIDLCDLYDNKIESRITKEKLGSSPAYSNATPLTREYEAKIHEHFDKRPYWL